MHEYYVIREYCNNEDRYRITYYLVLLHDYIVNERNESHREKKIIVNFDTHDAYALKIRFQIINA